MKYVLVASILLLCGTVVWAQEPIHRVYLPLAVRQVTSTPIPLPTQTPMPTATSVPTATPICECSVDLYNCLDFDTQAGAQAYFDYCWSLGAGDIHRLDADGDGIPCESLPGAYLPVIYRDMRR